MEGTETTETSEPVVVEIQPSADPVETLDEASQSVASALTTVKQIEVQALSETVTVVKELALELSGLISQVRDLLNQAEDLKAEAVELVEALTENQQETDGTDSGENGTPAASESQATPGAQEFSNPPKTNSRMKEAFKAIL